MDRPSIEEWWRANIISLVDGWKTLNGLISTHPSQRTICTPKHEDNTENNPFVIKPIGVEIGDSKFLRCFFSGSMMVYVTAAGYNRKERPLIHLSSLLTTNSSNHPTWHCLRTGATWNRQGLWNKWFVSRDYRFVGGWSTLTRGSYVCQL